MKALTRSTPITLMLRDHVPWLLPPSLELANGAADILGSNARAAYESFLQYGALYPAHLGSLLQLLPSQVEDALGELAAAGLVTSDGYPALRSLLGTVTPRRMGARRARARRSVSSASQPAGRWTLLRFPLLPGVEDDDRIEQWCRLLLRRYGIVFRDLLANESAAPPWHVLVRTLRRLEARGEIRGGRFVAGVGGEQYGLPEAIPLLRSASEEIADQPLNLPATDPLNLTGRIDARPRIPAVPGHSIAITRGVALDSRGIPTPATAPRISHAAATRDNGRPGTVRLAD